MSFVLPDKIVDVQLTALSGIKRTNAFVDFPAEQPQLLDMRKQFAPDLLLVRSGQVRNFGNGLLECLHHAATLSLSHCLCTARKRDEELEPYTGEARDACAAAAIAASFFCWSSLGCTMPADINKVIALSTVMSSSIRSLRGT